MNNGRVPSADGPAAALVTMTERQPSGRSAAATMMDGHHILRGTPRDCLMHCTHVRGRRLSVRLALQHAAVRCVCAPRRGIDRCIRTAVYGCIHISYMVRGRGGATARARDDDDSIYYYKVYIFYNKKNIYIQAYLGMLLT